MEKANRDQDEPNRKRCCLGFFANACGLSDNLITDSKEPFDVPEDVSLNFASPDWRNLNSALGGDMMGVNDDETLSDKDREEELIVLFDKAGHEIVFVN